MMKMTDNLKPCPLCGGRPYVKNKENKDGAYWLFVVCNSCGMRSRGKWVIHRSKTCPMHHESVREEWNTRSDDELRKLVREWQEATKYRECLDGITNPSMRYHESREALLAYNTEEE